MRSRFGPSPTGRAPAESIASYSASVKSPSGPTISRPLAPLLLLLPAPAAVVVAVAVPAAQLAAAGAELPADVPPAAALQEASGETAFAEAPSVSAAASKALRMEGPPANASSARGRDSFISGNSASSTLAAGSSCSAWARRHCFVAAAASRCSRPACNGSCHQTSRSVFSSLSFTCKCPTAGDAVTFTAARRCSRPDCKPRRDTALTERRAVCHICASNRFTNQ